MHLGLFATITQRSKAKRLGIVASLAAFSSLTPIFHCFRTLKHLLATGACQVQSEDAYYSHLVLRLMGCFVLFYTACVVFKGWATMKDMVFSLKHYWCFVDLEALQLHAPSWRLDRKVA
jgi:hypothetical protein